MPDQAGQDFRKTIDLVVKATAIALSVLYIFGYFVVSLRLAEFGIHSVALLRIQYLAAGFFSLGPLFLIYCFRQLDLAPFDLLFWPHLLVNPLSAPGRSEALRRP